jgi:hypothetical protein
MIMAKLRALCHILLAWLVIFTSFFAKVSFFAEEWNNPLKRPRPNVNGAGSLRAPKVPPISARNLRGRSGRVGPYLGQRNRPLEMTREHFSPSKIRDAP